MIFSQLTSLFKQLSLIIHTNSYYGGYLCHIGTSLIYFTRITPMDRHDMIDYDTKIQCQKGTFSYISNET